MNVGGTRVEAQEMNVVPLFSEIEIKADPFRDLLDESMLDIDFHDDEVQTELRVGQIVSEEQFPDQSMYTLENQLKKLKESLSRIKFYLGDVDDLLPR